MSDTTRETLEYKGYTINIECDSNPANPREWDNLGTMVCFHKRYNLGDTDHRIQQDEWWNEKTGEYEHCDSWEDVKKQIEVKYGELAVILPLGLYDHSGISMYVGNTHDRWDGGQVGFIFITKEKAKNEYGFKKLTKKWVDQLTEYLTNEVKTYDDYLTGQVYGYEVHKDGEFVDSCWGYYGYNIDYCMSEAKSVVDADIKSNEVNCATGKHEYQKTLQELDELIVLKTEQCKNCPHKIETRYRMEGLL